MGTAAPISSQCSMAASIGQRQSWVITTEMVWSTRPTNLWPGSLETIYWCQLLISLWCRNPTGQKDGQLGCVHPQLLWRPSLPHHLPSWCLAVAPYLRICLANWKETFRPSKRLHLHTPSHPSQVCPQANRFISLSTGSSSLSLTSDPMTNDTQPKGVLLTGWCDINKRGCYNYSAK